MALLDFEAEMARAVEGRPFANGFEGESWMSLWCEDGCVNQPDCPLLVVALLGRTPKQWEDKEPGSLNRYECHVYEEEK